MSRDEAIAVVEAYLNGLATKDLSNVPFAHISQARNRQLPDSEGKLLEDADEGKPHSPSHRFRGYAQFVLSEGIVFWPAAFLLSASFGALHLQNPGEGWVGALSVTVFGLFACFTLRRTGSLWFAVGFHAAGDFAETFLYSVPDSGMLAKGHLLNSNLHGPRWLTGGTIGPEGSVFDFLLFLMVFVIFAWLYPPLKPENPWIESAPQPAGSSAPTL